MMDLLVFHKDAHEVRPKEAALWSLFWVVLSLLFNGFVYLEFGKQAGIEFLTGYLIEKSLSVDNLFVFVLVFSYFKVPARYQHRVLFWGIIGALLMRALLIGVGAFLIREFAWMVYVFGAFLLYTGIRMSLQKETAIEVEANPLIKMLRRIIPITNRYHGQSFLIREAGKLVATPLLVVLVMVESTDVIFALDSIPAIFAVTDDPFIVYTSNIFAILGLRALYFLLANIIDKFHFLKYGLSIVLSYIGVKMLITIFDIHINTIVSLCIVAIVLIGSVLLSLAFPRKDHESLMPITVDDGGEDPISDAPLLNEGTKGPKDQGTEG
ncbi:MAG: TerC family protein [bacterium]|nr:TerC family protein [Candidatus Kapabacteria bacterium]